MRPGIRVLAVGKVSYCCNLRKTKLVLMEKDPKNKQRPVGPPLSLPFNELTTSRCRQRLGPYRNQAHQRLRIDCWWHPIQCQTARVPEDCSRAPAAPNCCHPMTTSRSDRHPRCLRRTQ